MTWGEKPSVLRGKARCVTVYLCAVFLLFLPVNAQDATPVPTDGPETPDTPDPLNAPAQSEVTQTGRTETGAQAQAPTPTLDPTLAPTLAPIPTQQDSATTERGETAVKEWAAVGGWDIGYYPASEGCLAFGLFENDTAFFIGFDNTGDMQSLDVTLIDRSWTQIKDGSEHDILVRFGDNPAWTLRMKGSQIEDFPALNIHMDANSPEARQFTRQFQHETQMEWLLNGEALARLTLSGSKRAFDEVSACTQADHSQPAPGILSTVTDMPYPR